MLGARDCWKVSLCPASMPGCMEEVAYEGVPVGRRSIPAISMAIFHFLSTIKAVIFFQL